MACAQPCPAGSSFAWLIIDMCTSSRECLIIEGWVGGWGVYAAPALQVITAKNICMPHLGHNQERLAAPALEPAAYACSCHVRRKASHGRRGHSCLATKHDGTEETQQTSLNPLNSQPRVRLPSGSNRNATFSRWMGHRECRGRGRGACGGSYQRAAKHNASNAV